MKIGIIGAGITGLTAAYELSKRNMDVAVLEARPETGGIAGTAEYDGVMIEKYYHHFFKSDDHIISLIKELGIGDELKWYKSSMGFFSGEKLYDFGTPLSLLKFKPLHFWNKIRFGMAVLKILGINDHTSLEYVTAHEWILKNAGRGVYESIWRPLLVSKFGEQYKDISMAWLWGKIKLRGTSKENGREVLGYIRGSNKVLLNKLEKELKNRGIDIVLNCSVKSISKSDGLMIETSKGSFQFDRIICTTQLPTFLNIARHILPESYIKEKGKIEYTSVVCMILILNRPFTKYYWLNMGDESIPFGGLIEHTNLLNRRDYNNNHILYISNYLYKDSPYYSMSENELLSQYIHHLKKVNPGFEESWVKKILLFKDEYAQPVIERFYSKIKPDFTTPVEGLYTAGMCNIYPEDRGMNYAVRDGIRVAEYI